MRRILFLIPVLIVVLTIGCSGKQSEVATKSATKTDFEKIKTPPNQSDPSQQESPPAAPPAEPSPPAEPQPKDWEPIIMQTFVYEAGTPSSAPEIAQIAKKRFDLLGIHAEIKGEGNQITISLLGGWRDNIFGNLNIEELMAPGLFEVGTTEFPLNKSGPQRVVILTQQDVISAESKTIENRYYVMLKVSPEGQRKVASYEKRHNLSLTFTPELSSDLVKTVGFYRDSTDPNYVFFEFVGDRGRQLMLWAALKIQTSFPTFVRKISEKEVVTNP